ncbi:hypothetical protein AJ79_02818 [Helicocarpus griseus UAMH5409]|uniref:Aminoglycoside phosphotransferase domain-containing protein n=1 Tax=Helicocarpus griseus UAMH5409 TaxID=1447875 RepID=A0A2B7Y1S4_9EURO|nr:hypothetical protein AJ79_02818 [Helicocarpus griseus UAMH5409]
MGDSDSKLHEKQEITISTCSSDGEEEIDIEALKIGASKIASRVVKELGGLDESSKLKYLASGVKLPETQLVLRIPKLKHSSLQPYQLRHEAACCVFLLRISPHIPAPRVLLWDDQPGCAFIAQDFILGQRLSVAWPDLTEEQKSSISREIANVVASLGETRFDFIGGLTLDDGGRVGPGPTIEAGKIFNGRAKFHSQNCYDIGPYANSRDYIRACYDREIYYYTNADKDDIIQEAFEKVTVPDFVSLLKVEREQI